MIQFLTAIAFASGANADERQDNRCAQSLGERATHAFGAVRGVSSGPLINVDAEHKLRLAGLVIPRVPRNRKDLEAVKSAATAQAQLRQALEGASVWAVPGFRTDRHGRKVAQLFSGVGDGTQRTWLQAAMVTAGYGRVSPSAQVSTCVAALLKLEAEARAKKAGLWAQKRYDVLEAWATKKLRRRENSFQLVQGTVTAVAETKRFTYVNFGKDWRTDFTVNISTRTAKRFKQNGFSLADLKGKTVRVRGWVRYANGPMIRASAPEQIEILDTPDK